MDVQKNYRSYPIPNREQLLKSHEYQSKHHKDTIIDTWDYDPFTEIDIKQSYTDCDEVPILPAQSINQVVDEKRALFYKMRQIAIDELYYDENNSKVFYRQAKFMENFEDDYEEQAPFLSYYPCYQKMSYEQLRTYFTWRTKVRGGNVTPTCLSYAFLYIYELINNIGVTNPEDGLDKLISFWQAYRAHDTVIDQYVLQWIKDYHVYYPLKRSFREFAGDYNIKMHYPTVFGYESDQENSFEIFARISKYNIKKSVFYNEENQLMIDNCFYFILNRIRNIFKENNKCFEDLVFFYIDMASVWVPFSRAIFYPALKQSNRPIAISDKEVYSCQYNQWLYKTVILSERGKMLIGYIMKEMETSLRKAVNFKYTITADLNMCDKEVRKILKSMGITFPKFIQENVSEFYSLSKRKLVKVDIGNINQIRQEALSTQERLIVTDDEDIEEIKVKEKTDINNKTEIIEKNIDQNKEIAKPVISDIWTAFIESLTQVEFEALKLTLKGQDIKEFAAINRTMLEVLIDGINQKSMDYVGDIILEVDDDVSIYEEYKTKLIEMVGY